jgi:hypothetical protein
MAERETAWQQDWHTGAWASTRAIWLRPSPEEERLDCDVWRTACDDPGSALAVLMCEFRQLLADLLASLRKRD